MPKKKTHKGAQKRVKITSTGLMLHRRRPIGKAVKARTATKRQNRKLVTMSPSDTKVFRKLLPGT